MEARGCNQGWKVHLPEFKHSRRFPRQATRDTENGKTDGDRGEPHKSVTMAPTSRYLTDRQYVMRKPLFSEEQYTSILKKTHPKKLTERDKPLLVSRGEENQQHTDMNFSNRARAELTPESLSLSHSDVSSPSDSREDLSSPSAVSELRARLCNEEPSFGSPFPDRTSVEPSLLSSILEVQRLNSPGRPLLASTLQYPSCTPCSEYSRPGRTQLRLGGRRGVCGEETQLCSSGGHSKGHPMSAYQANYWACAIPKTLPSCHNRRSAVWDPNREYQTLLDYTYPLKPGQVVSEWDSSKFQGDSLLKTESNLQDSGIELDHFCSSASLSGLAFTGSGTGQTSVRSPVSVGHISPDLQTFTRCSDGLLPSTDPLGLSSDTLDTSKNRRGMNRHKSDGHHNRQHELSTASTAFIRSTSVLPQSRCVCGEVDEEFWPLPEQLEELQLLSRQVREVTAQLSQPVRASWESVGTDTASMLSSIILPKKREAEDKEETEVNEPEGREEMSAAQTAADHRGSEAVRRSSDAWVEPVGEGLSQSTLKEVEALVEQLSGFSLPGSQRSSRQAQEQSDSLMQHIKAFCLHLEQLIQWLYTVSEKMELLATPTVDIDSVKSSLAEYQSFQRELSSHQPLTSCVLHTGRLLLSCINSTSPFLRNTLLLIERQTGVLETHTEHFFSSILSAMDSLTQPSPAVQQSRTEESGPVVAQGSIL